MQYRTKLRPNRVSEPGGSYGGQWTVEKLAILESYLDAYTTALKNEPFELVYIDAFAGSGYVEIPLNNDPDATDFMSGSPTIAANIQAKKFDRLIFVEKDPARCDELESLKAGHPELDIRIVNADANTFLHDLDHDWGRWRGVLFLDPFATEVEWSTIARIAGFNALDTWILFPVSAIARMLPTGKRPDDIAPGWAGRLTTVFGDESWRELYRRNPQQDLFGWVEYERTPGVEGLLEIYKDKLTGLFKNRFLRKSRTLRNSTNSVLFEFLFCVGSSSPKAIGAAQRIARHILEEL